MDFAVEKVSNYDFRYVLSSLGDRIVLLDHGLKKVVWLSQQFEQTYSKITIESSLDHVIACIGETKESINLLNTYFDDENSSLKKANIRCGKYMAAICWFMDSMTLIRIEPILMSDEEANRYLADREKLFITSRSFSVSEMASTLAHEINQPIGAINNLLHGVRDRIRNISKCNATIVTALDKSLEQVEFISKFIARIRDYTQSFAPEIKRIEIVQLINKCISLMDWEVKNQNIKLRYLTTLKSVYINGDELMLQQVIVNLIRNGLESIDESEKDVKIDLTIDGHYLHITIEDNGRGLSGDDTDSVFIPFVSKKDRGMGIGLNICRSFIELHRGRIWLTNNSDQGCTSHILLPYQ
jgi:signal transduction histidine kinase